MLNSFKAAVIDQGLPAGPIGPARMGTAKVQQQQPYITDTYIIEWVGRTVYAHCKYECRVGSVHVVQHSHCVTP